MTTAAVFDKTMNEIFKITSIIQDECPELYPYLNESPFRFIPGKDKIPSISDSRKYLSSLIIQWTNFKLARMLVIHNQ